VSKSENSVTKNIVSLSNIHFSYGSRPVHQGLKVEIEQGSVTAIMGPSGWRNVTKLNNTDLYSLRKSMGMMFQHNALLTDLTVFENIAFSLREHQELNESELSEIVLNKLELVGLKEAASLYPEECSGGMQRRVALARAIAMNPEIVMYDEPFTGLDPISKGVITSLIRKMNDQLKTTSIMVTHDVPEACQIADVIYILGDGKVLGKGTPKEMMNSSDKAVRQFMNGEPEGPVAFHYPAQSSGQ